MTLVLVVDDVRALAEQYAYDLGRLGEFETAIAGDGAEALDILARDAVDCVLLDLEMPGTDGFETLRTMKQRGLTTPVIVYTGTGNYDRCVQAIKLGAHGFLDKSEAMERVVQEIHSAIERRDLLATVEQLHRRLDGETALIGSSPAMDKLRDSLRRLGPIPSPVLIAGESGSGKELVATDLHRLRPLPEGRRRGELPFVAVNCAALPEQLIESELFGHERGAFTGANALRKGAFEAAGAGTLFLDEIGELPLPAQAKLLRVLEQHEVTRLGGNRTVPVKARVVAATNRKLEDEVEAKRFRQDLLFRLNVHTVKVPPLRDRMSDLPELVDHFLTTVCERFGMKRKTVGSDALDRLMSYDWAKNNVRELRNVVERMIIACDGDTIGAEHVPPEISGDVPISPVDSTLRELKAEAERRIVIEALERHEWHITNTARALGLSDHASLLKVMRRHNISRPSSRAESGS